MKNCLDDCFDCKIKRSAGTLRCLAGQWITEYGQEKIIKLTRNDAQKIQWRNIFLLADGCEFFNDYDGTRNSLTEGK